MSSEATIRQEDVDFRVSTPGLYAFQVRSFNGSGPFTLELQNVQMSAPTPNTPPSINGIVGVDRTVSGATNYAGWPTPTVIPTFLTCDKQGSGLYATAIREPLDIPDQPVELRCVASLPG